MNRPEAFDIDMYPWAAPTEEQKAAFDALSPEAKRRAVRAAIEEGISSPLSSATMEEIIASARRRLANGS